MNIKNDEVERLAAEVARITVESKTEAIRQALVERPQRLAYVNRSGREAQALRFLEREVWPRIPKDQRGRSEVDDMLGYGAEGV